MEKIKIIQMIAYKDYVLCLDSMGQVWELRINDEEEAYWHYVSVGI